MALQLSSSAFEQGAEIPKKYTCEGDNVSPPLRWRDPPPGTRSYLLVCHDPDAPGGTFRHWAAHEIPTERLELKEGDGNERSEGLEQAVNGFGKAAYGGPCPPEGHGVHHYHFRLMALSEPSLPVASDASCAEVEAVAEPHIIAEAELVGTYQR